jgi:hypothetical protein
LKNKIIALTLTTLALTGCVTVPQTPKNPPKTAISNDVVSGMLIAVCDEPKTCQSFELSLDNNTNGTIEIDWNRSYYINNGKPDGGLYFDGIVITQRNNPRSPDIILPMSNFKRRLAPSNNFNLNTFPLAHWALKTFEGKSHGIYITIKVDGKEQVIRAEVTIPQSK